jgi:hypothetical protein
MFNKFHTKRLNNDWEEVFQMQRYANFSKESREFRDDERQRMLVFYSAYTWMSRIENRSEVVVTAEI